jgi:CBS domain containing-hemolysin-like protein
MIIVLLAGAAVVLASALLAMVEAAFLTLPLVRARALAKLGGRTARAVLRIREKVQNAITAIVLLDTMVDTVGSVLVATLAAAAAEEAARQGDLLTVSVAWVTALLTVAMIFLGEIVPKVLGERFHVGVTLLAAYPVLLLVAVFHPVVWFTERVVARLFPGRRKSVTTEEEISALAEQAREEGAIKSREAEVIQRVFRLNDITAEDVMTPRIRARMLPAASTLEEARADLRSIGSSRIPVFAGTRDNVTGIVRRADALGALAEGKGTARLGDLAAKPKFVAATTPVDRLLLEFQRERVQLGIVVGEYGETVGLVTVEDIMEELVGEILDEKDVDERSIKRVSKDEILVHGQTEIARVNHFFNTELPEDRPTVAGLLLERLERLPRPGEHAMVEGLDFVVDEVNDRAIVRVRILKPAGDRAASAPAPADAGPG